MTTQNKKAVVFPARGIGDALLMMIASERLRKEGYEVTTVHPKLLELQRWFPEHRLAKKWTFSDDEWIIVENDNSERVRLLKTAYRSSLSVLYPTYSFRKHGLLSARDRAFNFQKSMAENIAHAICSLLGKEEKLKENGISPPPGLIHRQHRSRVVIHPTSSDRNKNWLMEKYEEVAKGLEKRGYEPFFTPEFENLGDLAAFIYESGFVIGNDSLLGHMASNLNVPTLIIADKAERMNLWRPGWLEGSVITLAGWVPRWNFFEKNWQYFISSARVLKAFDDLAAAF